MQKNETFSISQKQKCTVLRTLCSNKGTTAQLNVSKSSHVLPMPQNCYFLEKLTCYLGKCYRPWFSCYENWNLDIVKICFQ